MSKILAGVLGLFLASTSFAMEYETVKVTVWRKGATIYGETFHATEAVLDYLATLKHPTEGFKTIRYVCQAKIRAIQQSLRNVPAGSTSNPPYLISTMVYDLKDCTESK